MAKLCPKGKAAAKRKFKVYPSAYANMYASGVCSGKITPGGKKGKRKKMSKGGGADFETSGTRIKPYGKTQEVKISKIAKRVKPFYRKESANGGLIVDEDLTMMVDV
jgi:hypothetical protein